MRKKWIDDEGRLRLDHDENYQMVGYGTHIDDVDWLMDSWSVEHACRMIVLGYNEDIKAAIDYGFKHCPEGTTGRDRARALIAIMDRVLTLAKAAVAIGILKENDTPKNWAVWAQSKGYNTDHLNPLSIADDVDTGTDTKPREGGYKKRDIFAIKLVKVRPELLTMRAGAIKAELQKASNIFTSGIDDWWRNNPIFPKSEAGRNSN